MEVFIEDKKKESRRLAMQQNAPAGAFRNALRTAIERFGRVGLSREEFAMLGADTASIEEIERIGEEPGNEALINTFL